MGINYVPLNYLFRMCNDRKDIMTYDIYVQMVEIYNEQVRDLLVEDETGNKIEIRSCNDDGLSLLDATLSPVTSTSDVLTLMKLGEVNYAVSSTALNNRSSRSHRGMSVFAENHQQQPEQLIGFPYKNGVVSKPEQLIDFAHKNDGVSKEEQLLNFELKSNGIALPPNFVSTHGERLGPIFYVIDELDNCLVLEVIRNNDQLLITDSSFEHIRTFYLIDRGASVQFRYDNQPIQVHLDPDCYVPELMDPETLDNVSRVFHIKYTRMDEDSSPDVIVLSGSEPSDDQFSSDGDEDNDQDGALVGDNLYNPIDLSSGSSLSLEVNEQSNAANKLVDHRYAPEVSYEKKITASDVGQSRLYLASKFTAYLKLSGDGSIWTITGPDSNVEKNVFFFHLLKSGGRGGEWKFGVGWSECCRIYNLKEGDIITLKLGSIANRQIELSIQRH
ncbi:hypothetical protein Ahy_B01g055399 [Arachis hypogaea]|uniref:Kinesin motor domain-containing protein n=1 Tax=Arachis hypogaea TaxID=3818 RepID=A0A445AW50_ARAHY|nr:hypothetical protein Ahy_B01g055399 [Arachis hypogaea]